MNSNEFTESGTVVITRCLGVTKGLEDGIRLDDLIFKRDFLCLSWLPTRTHAREVGNDLLRVLCLPSTRLTSGGKNTKVSQSLRSTHYQSGRYRNYANPGIHHFFSCGSCPGIGNCNSGIKYPDFWPIFEPELLKLCRYCQK